MPGQLIFNLPTQDNFNSQDFFVSSSNSNVVKLLNYYPQWHNNGIIIYGNKKSGKTHLAHIWKLSSNAIIYDFKNDQDMNQICTSNNYVFDNFDLLSDNDEKVFFQIYNEIVNNKNYILFLTNKRNLSIKLKDLSSRINSLNKAGISDPDDLLIQALILKYFHDMQIKVSPDVIKFILNRVDRNFEQIQIFLDRLNHLSIEHKSKISIHFLNKFFTF